MRSIASGIDNRSRELMLSPEGKLVAIVEDKAIRLVESTTGRKVCTISCEFGRYYRTAVAFAPDGSSLAAALKGGSIKVYETATGKELQSIDAGGSRTNPLFFAHGGNHLISIKSNSFQAPLVTWDLATGKVIQTTYLRKSNSVSLSFSAFSPDAELAAGVKYSARESQNNSDKPRFPITTR